LKCGACDLNIVMSAGQPAESTINSTVSHQLAIRSVTTFFFYYFLFHTFGILRLIEFCICPFE